MTRVLLKSAHDLLPEVQRVLARVEPLLRQLLPHAEVAHIGGTAVPGALTKGDLDVVVRVASEEFSAAVEALTAHFGRKQRENWTADFASFGDDTGFELPLGVQLVSRNSDADFLTFLRDYLMANANALAEYNRLKVQHAPEGAEAYWTAKHAFFTKILAARGQGGQP